MQAVWSCARGWNYNDGTDRWCGYDAVHIILSCCCGRESCESDGWWAESEHGVHIFLKKRTRWNLATERKSWQRMCSYQESVTDYPGGCVTAGCHFEECTDTLSVRHLRELEVGRTDRPWSSTKGHRDVDLSITSCGRWTLRLNLSVRGSDRLTVRVIVLKIAGTRCWAWNLSKDSLNSARGATDERCACVNSRVRFGSCGKSDAVALNTHACTETSTWGSDCDDNTHQSEVKSTKTLDHWGCSGNRCRRCTGSGWRNLIRKLVWAMA